MDQNEQKHALTVGFICSFVYLAFFFLSFYLFVFVPELLGNPDMTTSLGLLLVFLSLLTPFSIVVSIALIWNRYLKQDYRGVYFACLIPPVTVLVVVILLKLIQITFL